MATQILELLKQNKNRAKRDLSSATFSLITTLPGGIALPDGNAVIGKLEGNIAITRVMLLVRDGFNGTLPTLSVADDKGNTYFTSETLAAEVVVESSLTANSAPGVPAPLFEETVTTFTATYAGGASTTGSVAVVVDYVQLDVVVGKYTR